LYASPIGMLNENAGLGYRKIVFNIQETEQQVHEKLVSPAQLESNDGSSSSLSLQTVGYPKLTSSGGFELMRCIPNCKVLEPIKGSMAVENLKRSVGQGKIYIRPIQSSLSILPLKGSATVQTSSLKERCMKCGELFSISLLRDHLLSCSVDNNSSDSSESDNETQEYVVTANSEEVNTGTDAPSLAPATTHDPPDDEMKDNETQEDVVTANNEEMNTTGTDTPSLATPRDPPDEFANSAFQIAHSAPPARFFLNNSKNNTAMILKFSDIS